MTPRTLFRLFAQAEMVTWAGLITALIVRGVDPESNFVPVAGGLHGFVFLSYCVVTVFVWVNERWRPGVGMLGLVTAIVPFATVPFELAIDKRGLLSRRWRLGSGNEAPSNVLEHLQAWVLRQPFLALALALLGITAVFVALLWLGPPLPRS